MTRKISRHFAEIIMILSELFICAMASAQMPGFVITISKHIGFLCMVCGVYSIYRYLRTVPTYMRYDPELYRGVTLLFVGFTVATMKTWFSVIHTTPAIAFGLTLLTIATFKAAILMDAKGSQFSYFLLFPVLSTFLTFALSCAAFASPFLSQVDFWLITRITMLGIALIDAYEILSSEMMHRESWSMQIHCWL